MLPLYREEDSVNVPVAVIALILLDSVLWVAGVTLSTPTSIFLRYGFVPEHASLRTALTSMFIHAGFWHLAGNMWFLWMFGRRVERSIGPWIFILLYLLSGLGGTMMHYCFNRGSLLPCVGASGAISGIIGCFFIFFPSAEFDLEIYLGLWRIRRTSSKTVGAVGAWFGEQLILGLLTQAVHFSTVAFWGHIGGFLIGVLGGLLLKSTLTVDGTGFNALTPARHGPRVMSKSDLIRLDLH